MKIAFSTSGNDPDAPLDPRFGRSPQFIVIDADNDAFEVIANRQNLNAAQGAGVQTAVNLVQAGVGAVITGHCGPKAFRVLCAAGIPLYVTDAPTVREAMRRFRAGELAAAEQADVEGHWM